MSELTERAIDVSQADDESNVHIDIERMERALASPRFTVPSGFGSKAVPKHKRIGGRTGNSMRSEKSVRA